MPNKTSGRVALCGVLAALMLVVMLFGTMIPLSTYACPALAGAISIPVIWELGAKPGCPPVAFGQTGEKRKKTK